MEKGKRVDILLHNGESISALTPISIEESIIFYSCYEAGRIVRQSVLSIRVSSINVQEPITKIK